MVDYLTMQKAIRQAEQSSNAVKRFYSRSPLRSEAFSLQSANLVKTDR